MVMRRMRGWSRARETTASWSGWLGIMKLSTSAAAMRQYLRAGGASGAAR